MSQTILEMAKDLIMAQIQAKALSPGEMHKALQQTYTSLMALKAQEEGQGTFVGEMPEAPPALADWRKSITRHAVVCLECGQSFKQLSVRHLQSHNLDLRSYRVKYGIPRRQPLAAKDITAMRKTLVQETRPWEKAPAFLKAQEKVQKTEVQKTERAPRKEAARARV